VAIHFQDDYQLLELDSSASWEQANENYRRLVQVWHPDRYSERPTELVHAQNQFIDLTKAFNNLRGFYRENSRLPFEQITQSTVDSSEPPEHQRIHPEDHAVLESSMLNKRKPSHRSLRSNASKPWLWIVPTLATVAAGVAVFFVIDRNAKLDTIEQAKRVLNNVQPSEYMADSEKINKANSRASMVSGAVANGQTGDKITKDLFE